MIAAGDSNCPPSAPPICPPRCPTQCPPINPSTICPPPISPMLVPPPGPLPSSIPTQKNESTSKCSPVLKFNANPGFERVPNHLTSNTILSCCSKCPPPRCPPPPANKCPPPPCPPPANKCPPPPCPPPPCPPPPANKCPPPPCPPPPCPPPTANKCPPKIQCPPPPKKDSDKKCTPFSVNSPLSLANSSFPKESFVYPYDLVTDLFVSSKISPPSPQYNESTNNSRKCLSPQCKQTSKLDNNCPPPPSEGYSKDDCPVPPSKPSINRYLAYERQLNNLMFSRPEFNNITPVDTTKAFSCFIPNFCSTSLSSARFYSSYSPFRSGKQIPFLSEFDLKSDLGHSKMTYASKSSSDDRCKNEEKNCPIRRCPVPPPPRCLYNKNRCPGRCPKRKCEPEKKCSSELNFEMLCLDCHRQFDKCLCRYVQHPPSPIPTIPYEPNKEKDTKYQPPNCPPQKPPVPIKFRAEELIKSELIQNEIMAKKKIVIPDQDPFREKELPCCNPKKCPGPCPPCPPPDPPRKKDKPCHGALPLNDYLPTPFDKNPTIGYRLESDNDKCNEGGSKNKCIKRRKNVPSQDPFKNKVPSCPQPKPCPIPCPPCPEPKKCHPQL